MRSERAVAAHAFRRLRVAASLWGVVFAATVASSALTYARTFPDSAARRQLAETTDHDAGVSMLLGPIAAIDTVAGYTVYKCFVTLTSIGAVWALLTTTRLLRGEEDAGRWQLLVAGGPRPVRATVATLAGIGGAIAVLVACTTAGAALAGRDPDVGFSPWDSLYYGLSIAIAPAVFAGVGALTSQLAGSRRRATGLGMAVFGVCFVLRMIADSGPATRWLLWCTPFGWVERMRPITENNVAPLVCAGVAVACLVGAALGLAARRDVGAAALAARPGRGVSRRRPASPVALAWRLDRAALLGWLGGVGGAGLCLGVVVKMTTGSASGSMTDLLDKFAVQGTFLRQYLGLAFLMLAALVALLPANQVGAAAEEEASNQLLTLLVQPQRRLRLFAGRMAIAVAAITTAGCTAGLSVWLGARLRGVDTGFAATVGAGLNLVPVGLLVLGVGVLARAVAPRYASGVVYALVGWSFVAELLGSLVQGTAWLERLSIFHYRALAPAQPVVMGEVVLTLTAAAASAVVAALLFSRRDLRCA